MNSINIAATPIIIYDALNFKIQKDLTLQQYLKEMALIQKQV